jgi:hypothetical protein
VTTATADPRVLTPEQVVVRQRRAIAKVVAGQGWENVRQVTDSEFAVTGSRGDEYLVSLAGRDRGGEPSCTCQAGYHGSPCWHQAACWIACMPPCWRAALVAQEG